MNPKFKAVYYLGAIIYICALASPLLINAGKALAFSGAGSGISSDPYQITDCGQLQEIADSPSSYYVLNNDVDCSATTGWNSGAGFTPITNFTGSLDGQNYTINNIFINSGGGNIAIFANTTNATIQNLTISAPGGIGSVTGDRSSAILSGSMDGGTISHVMINEGFNTSGSMSALFVGHLQCTTAGSSVNINNVAGSSNVTYTAAGVTQIGGLIGFADAGKSTCPITIDSSTVQSDINFSESFGFGNAPYGASAVGGFIGEADAHDGGTLKLTNATFNGDILAAEDTAGGFIGKMHQTNCGILLITNSSSVGDIYADPNGSGAIGGLVGQMDNAAQIIQSHLNGSTNAGSYEGDVVGKIYGDGKTTNIDQVYTNGSVNDGGSSSYLGEIAGYMSDGIISNSFAKNGEIWGNGDNIGGLVGGGSGDIINSYASGNIFAAVSSNNIGGIYGSFTGSSSQSSVGLENNFSTEVISGGSTNIGSIYGDNTSGSAVPNLSTDYFDPATTLVNDCGWTSGVADGCSTGAFPTFQNDNSNPPVSSWDFGAIWITESSDYPALQMNPGDNSGESGCINNGGSNSGGNTGGNNTSGQSNTASQTTTQSSSSFTTQELSLSTTPTSPTEQILLNDLAGFTDSSGTNLDLSVGQVVQFDLTNNGATEHHTATVKEVGPDYVIFTIASTPFDVKVYVGQSKSIIIDGKEVMKITLNSIAGGVFNVSFASATASKTITNKPASPSTQAGIYPKSHKWAYYLAAGAAGLVAVVLIRKRYAK